MYGRKVGRSSTRTATTILPQKRKEKIVQTDEHFRLCASSAMHFPTAVVLCRWGSSVKYITQRIHRRDEKERDCGE